MTDERLESLFGTSERGVLVTLKHDGRPQLSNVAHTWDAERRLIRISVTESRVKTRNLRRDPRASYYVTTPDLWAYVVAEGTAQVGPVATDPHGAVVDELVEIYRLIQGEHPDWEEFRAAMVADHRLVITLPVDRTYGWSRS
ncbi:PPOX class F420-dependent oxidoreductase [Streptomyces sp. TP-A0874]|uniref:PPOX class F420-dependent oxidoreductase n=1 Tax=Streptomyces sp. TP-A0874 TaxID=549819 RepID=UPI000852BA3A|nr:PPOX class F420-dependent oxidoreductase [Streptomyces sp. TP-A0874]